MFKKAILALVLAAALAADHYYPDAALKDVTDEPVQWVTGDGKKSAILMQDGAKPVEMRVAALITRVRLEYGADNGAVNAALAAKALDGTIVEPGGIFSFNAVVGPRTASRGYVEGASIMQTEEGLALVPDVGGGVCRTATALHMAVQAAGLEVVEHHSHGLPVGYARPGEDAAVAWLDLDYRFRNTKERAVMIKATPGKDCCEIEIWKVF
ncbi:MAG: VanW family protein [Firmicutes bacterium]|nr:VanW family protein [Bacillota bacterium]